MGAATEKRRLDEQPTKRSSRESVKELTWTAFKLDHSQPDDVLFSLDVGGKVGVSGSMMLYFGVPLYVVYI